MFLHLPLLFSPGVAMSTPHDSYFFHGFAGNQIVGDPAFYDVSGNGAHALPGVNLSNANLWTNAGYASTIDPAGGATDSVLRLPNLNFDYNGGERLVVFWLGKCTAEVANAEMMGDGTSTAGAGVSVRASTDQTWQLILSDGTTQSFSGTSAVTAFDGSLKAIAFVIDGSTKKYCLWTQDSESRMVPFSSTTEYQVLASGVERDTRNPNTWNIGCARPKSAVSTSGIATQTRALVIMRFSPVKAMPTIARMTQIFNALRASPSQLVRAEAF